MSPPDSTMKETQKTILGAGIESVADRFHFALTTSEVNKPDSKDFDLGSPFSPLRLPGFTHTSSSSSSSGSTVGRTAPNADARKSGDVARKSHSGELSGSGESISTVVDSFGLGGSKNLKPGHRRSGSGPLIYSGGGDGASSVGGSVNSRMTNVLPTGNICPSGKIGKTGMMCRSTVRSDVLGSGSANYGHGSIMRGFPGTGKSGGETTSMGSLEFAATARKAVACMDPEEVKRAGNEQYKRGNFPDALRLYDRAIEICPDNVAFRSNRAAALMAMGRLGEAVRECEEAEKLDPTYGRAHQRLTSLYIRLGQVENARRHICFAGQQSDPMEWQKLQAVERHLHRCSDAWKIRDWKSALRESEAAIAAGSDSSPSLVALRAEALLRLHRIEEADSALSIIFKLETASLSGSHDKFSGMLTFSYLYAVRAQVEMALGRFDNAVEAAEKAAQIDFRNVDVATVVSNVKSAAKAQGRGKELFSAGKFEEACMAYREGLKFDPFNPVLFCNRAVCWSKLGQWEKSVEDCNEALRIQPSYTKALLRRASSYGKMERWAESVCDYEVLRKKLPSDNVVSEALFHAQIALKNSCDGEAHNWKLGGEVEEIMGLEQFRTAISLPRVSVVHFMTALNQNCVEISPFVDALCRRYSSVNFLKVDIDQIPAVAKAENTRTVPTFKIYKNGARVKEMILPSQQMLEYSVRHYCS